MAINTSGKLESDPNGHIIQCFAPNKLVSITAAGAWVPEAQDRVVRVSVPCEYTFTGESDNGTLIAGSLFAIKQGVAYTFNATMIIEVM